MKNRVEKTTKLDRAEESTQKTILFSLLDTITGAFGPLIEVRTWGEMYRAVYNNRLKYQNPEDFEMIFLGERTGRLIEVNHQVIKIIDILVQEKHRDMINEENQERINSPSVTIADLKSSMATGEINER